MTTRVNPLGIDGNLSLGRTRSGLVSVGLLFMLPLMAVFASMHLRDVGGPYYFSENLDPSYLYLLNSLNIATLHRPFYTDHPGTPIEITGGVVIKAMNFSNGRDQTERNVLQDPERYLRTLNNGFIVLYAVCLVVAGYVALLVTQNLGLAFLLQLTPLLSITVLQGLTGLRPEPLLVSLSLLIATVVLLTIKYDVEHYALRYVLAFGVICGLAMAAKINFLPVLLVPLVVLRSWRWRIAFCAVAGLAFLIAILPILTPMHMRNMFGFLMGVTTHTGRYGVGKAGFIDPKQYVLSVVNLIRGDLLFFVVLLLTILLVAASKRLGLFTGARKRALIAVAAAEVLQLLMVAKHPHSRYLVPGIALAGLNLLLVTEAAAKHFRPARLSTVSFGLGLLIIMIGGLQLRWAYSNAEQLAARQASVKQKIDSDYSGIPVVEYYSASSLPYALKFGSGYSGNLFGPVLKELYPRSYFYSPWEGHFSDFARTVEAKEIAAERGWFVLHGYSLVDSDFRVFLPEQPLPANIKVENLYRGDSDRIGELDGEAIYAARFSDIGR